MKKLNILFIGLLILVLFPMISASCPLGTTTPYCSSLDTNGYYQCIDGISYHYPCPSMEICSNGKCILPPCPLGTTTPYCSAKDNFKGYFYCKDGRTYHNICPNPNDNCKNGQCVDICEGINGPYCSNADPIAIFSCVDSTPLREQCNKNILGVQFVCKNGQCVPPESGVFPNKSESNVCEDCDAYAISYFLGGFMKEKKCDSKGFTISWDFLPQGTTKCMLSFIKLLLTPIVFIFTFLFGIDYLTRFKSLKGKKGKLPRFGVSIIISLILAYTVYMYFWYGILIFGIVVAIKSGIKSFLPIK